MDKFKIYKEFYLSSDEIKERINELTITGDEEDIVKLFLKYCPVAVYKKKFFIWNREKFIWELTEIDGILRIFKKVAPSNLKIAKGSVTTIYKNAIKQNCFSTLPPKPPSKWIQFQDKVFTLTEKKTKKESFYIPEPNYFHTNSLPWKIGESTDTPVIDKLFHEWVEEKYVEDLYELIAYCCYREYPIETSITLFGGGSNGKTIFTKILTKFLGKSNKAETTLNKISGDQARFETARLFNKLACFINEMPNAVFKKTDIFKAISSGADVSMELKGGDLFDTTNYAKIIITTNFLPATTDNTKGYYRRWYIIKFPNYFEGGRDVTKTIPDYEYENLSKKVTEILPVLLKRGKFKNMPVFSEQKKIYKACSNPINQFLDEACDKLPKGSKDNSYYIEYKLLFKVYKQYLSRMDYAKILTKREFEFILEGINIFKTQIKRDISENGKEGIYKDFDAIKGYKFKEDYIKEHME